MRTLNLQPPTSTRAGLTYTIAIDFSRRHPFEPPVVSLADTPRNHSQPRLGDLAVMDHQVGAEDMVWARPKLG